MVSESVFKYSAPHVEQEQVDSEVLALSPEDQIKVINDVYGRKQLQRKPKNSFLGEFLLMLDEELDAIPVHEKESFLKAQEICPLYANCESFRRRFLDDGENNGAAEAAQKIVKYFSVGFALWGEAAFRNGPPTLSDFPEGEVIGLQNGGVQLSSEPDKSGRAVVLFDCLRFPTNTNSTKRLIWYLHEIALESASVRKNGFVYLLWHSRGFLLKNFNRHLHKSIFQLLQNVLPVHFAAIHICQPNPLFMLVVPALMFLMGTHWRARCRTHLGGQDTILCELEDFGITTDLIGKEFGGEASFRTISVSVAGVD